MHDMSFTTINDNLAHRNLSGQSKRKGAACPHCLEDTCAIWLRHSKKYVFMGHRRFLSKKHPYRAMDCQVNGEKENRESSLHVTGDLVHLKVKDIKTIEELPKLTEKTLLMLWDNASQYPLLVPIDGGDVATLTKALVQRVQWPKDMIIIPPMTRHPNPEVAIGSRGTTLDGGAAAQCQQEKAQQQQQISKTTQQERRQKPEEEPRLTPPKQLLQLEDNQQTK
jgi:hypothetical protein